MTNGIVTGDGPRSVGVGGILILLFLLVVVVFALAAMIPLFRILHRIQYQACCNNRRGRPVLTKSQRTTKGGVQVVMTAFVLPSASLFKERLAKSKNSSPPVAKVGSGAKVKEAALSLESFG